MTGQFQASPSLSGSMGAPRAMVLNVERTASLSVSLGRTPDLVAVVEPAKSFSLTMTNGTLVPGPAQEAGYFPEGW